MPVVANLGGAVTERTLLYVSSQHPENSSKKGACYSLLFSMALYFFVDYELFRKMFTLYMPLNETKYAIYQYIL